MDIKQLILNGARKKGQITAAEIVRATGLSRAFVHRFFKELTDSGRIVRFGRANQTRYVLADEKHIETIKGQFLSIVKTFRREGLQEDDVLSMIKKETGVFQELPEHIAHILDFAFTEMLNNAIEHSHSEQVRISFRCDEALVRFEVIDRGVGIFENLIHSRHLGSADEAIQDLLKGKQTTMPESHTGEGIFFTRQAGDTFSIRSSDREIFFNNMIQDMTVRTLAPIMGTKIMFAIAVSSPALLADIFKKYSTEEYEFHAADVLVRLYNPGGSKDFISRSQARRIFSGLEKFKKITLDFSGVVAVGQGFADEVFRVWQAHHPDITIDFRNTNKDIEFMIKHAKLSKL